MNTSRLKRITLALLPVAAGIALTGCGSSGSSTTTAGSSASSAAAEAQNTAQGDIPDNQQFLTFKNSSGGYSVKYPEGWAQKGSGGDVTFLDKENSVHVVIASGSTPTVSSVRAELKKEAAAAPTLKPGTPQAVKLPSGPAVHVVYHVQGPPDPVTGKRPTLMVDRYVFANKGRVATVDEATPVGVDNVDAYRMIIDSFQWA
jgi:hypothetical protein